MGIDSGGNRSGENFAQMGIVSIPKISKYKQIFIDQFINVQVRSDRVRNDRGLQMIGFPIDDDFILLLISVLVISDFM